MLEPDGHHSLIYQMYEAQRTMLAPLQAFSALTAASIPDFGSGSNYARAGYGMLARTSLTHRRPAFGIATVATAEGNVRVRERVVLRTPFATLLHFAKEGVAGQPRVLVVAPISGHFPTLLRGTIETMLPEHDLYVTDWHNARDVAPRFGRFGLDEFLTHVVTFLEKLGPGAHVVAVCQPAVPVLAAVAVMAEDGNPAQPRSMTLMAGPVDTRINPTKVNELATSRELAWFERNLIDVVPWNCRGAGRRVYPGFVQLSSFVSMNPERHARAHQDLYGHLVDGDEAKAQPIREFYDEYFAVSDLPAEFYLETVRTVFQEHALARGRYTYRGRVVNPAAIERTALLTVEGENDDVCGLGQTFAAHALCAGLPAHMKRHHVQSGAGHYGVFSGKRWQNHIYPAVRATIAASSSS